MVVVILSVFFTSLILIALLFALKFRELQTGTVFMPEFKMAADKKARHLKELLFAAKLDSRKIVPLTIYWLQIVLHRAAIAFARGARTASQKAHQLADFVSHKRNFQPRQTKSEFLRKVSMWKSSATMDRNDNTE